MKEVLGLKDAFNYHWQQKLKAAVDEKDELFSIAEPLSLYLISFVYQHLRLTVLDINSKSELLELYTLQRKREHLYKNIPQISNGLLYQLL